MEVTNETLRQMIIEVLGDLSSHLENSSGTPRGAEMVTDLDNIKNVLSLPGVKYDDNPVTNDAAKATVYVQIPYSILSDALAAMKQATTQATTAAGSVDDAVQSAEEAAALANTAASSANTAASNADTARQQIESNEQARQTAESTRQGNEDTRLTNEQGRQQAEIRRATADETRNDNEQARQANEDTRQANEQTRQQQEQARQTATATAIANAEAATARAENVDATLVGMTVTITGRDGQSHSQNIGFEIARDHVYPSVAAMQADAANVLAGKFCMVATTDPASEDNARLYAKNSAGGFTFLSDLDQAATHAFADWMDNYKPVIESDHARAEADHTTADDDHTIAAADHSAAASDHTQAGTDHDESATQSAYAKQQGDYAKNMADHPAYIADGTNGDANYWYVWNYATQSYTKAAYSKGDNLDWDGITQQEKQMLIGYMLQLLEEDGFDDAPTKDSSKPVRSTGIKTYVDGVAAQLTELIAVKQDAVTFEQAASARQMWADFTY